MALEEVRINIDRVDSQIKALFQERMELADQVAQVKAETGDTILKPERENQIIEKLSKDVEGDIRKEYIALIKRIMEVSRKYQYGRTLALRDCFQIDYETKDCAIKSAAMKKTELYICSMLSKDQVTTVDSYDEIADLIEQGEVEAGIGILENVSVAAVNELHTLLVEHHFYINRCEIVWDHGIRKKVVQFGKTLLAQKEHNRIKMMFVCPNKSGALASILSMISDYNVNLTEIHSRPNQEKDWNYEFYAEINANLLETETKALLYQLQNETAQFQILGSYACEGDF